MTASTPAGYLQQLLSQITEDLRSHVTSDEETGARLRASFEGLRSLGRPLPGWQSWLADRVTHSAVAWLVGTLVLRQIEHESLLPSARPTVTRQRWLQRRFEEVARATPGIRLFQPGEDPLFDIPVSEQIAKTLHDIVVGHDAGLAGYATNAGTSWLGDVYQDVVGRADGRHALIQTPSFVVEHILDLTLRSALTENPPHALRVMDPVCGSGEFLVRAFTHTLAAIRADRPDMPAPEAARRALGVIHGMDINPASATITRFRLLTAALAATGESTLDRSIHHDWRTDVRTGDSLLDLLGQEGSYDVVIGNPPYVLLRDNDLDRAYRERYSAAQGRFPLTVPFIELFVRLARHTDGGEAGHIGLLCADSFSKREFGRRLIEDFILRELSITHLIDLSGAFIPGHGTPTLILTGRHSRSEPTDQVPLVLSLRGEPRPPADPARGLVWQSILRSTEFHGHRDEWTISTVIDHARVTTFPWSFATGDAAELIDHLGRMPRLDSLHPRIGYRAAIGAEEIFTGTFEDFERSRAESGALVPVISGEHVRDWSAHADRYAFHGDPHHHPGHMRRMWPYRTVLGKRKWFGGKTYDEAGTAWYSWHQQPPQLDPAQSITYAGLGTTPHFALLPAGTAALPSAPVIQLTGDTTADELTAYLNTSTACFWLKQFSPEKGQPNAHQTVGEGEPWESHYQFPAAQIRDVPLPPDLHLPYSFELASLADQLARHSPQAVLADQPFDRERFLAARSQWTDIRHRMVALAEETDWHTYAAFGICDANLTAPAEPPGLEPGQRAFEIVLAQEINAGNVTSRWFERHRITPFTEGPATWPPEYHELVARRVQAIRNDDRIATLENAAHKRRWSSPGWDVMARKALERWILHQCEQVVVMSPEHRLWTTAEIAVAVAGNTGVAEAAAQLAPDRTLAETIRELVLDSQVPVLAALRYRAASLAKWQEWRAVWSAQAQADLAGQSSGEIPLPPRYMSADYLKPTYWRLRGKYDVPTEAFFSSPTGEGLVVGCARWTPAERAQAIMTALAETPPSTDVTTLVPLLAGLHETISQERIPPSLRNTMDPTCTSTLTSWQERLGLTDEDLRSWLPEPPRRGRPRKAP